MPPAACREGSACGQIPRNGNIRGIAKPSPGASAGQLALQTAADDVNESLSSSDKSLEIITPRDWKERGCQVSVIAHGCGKDLFDKLTKEGVISDRREPNAIRMAPIPLYNSYEDIYRFGEILKQALI